MNTIQIIKEIEKIINQYEIENTILSDTDTHSNMIKMYANKIVILELKHVILLLKM